MHPLPKVAAATRHVLLDIETFSRYVLKTPLYAYQLDPARAIMDSIANGRGDEILLIMSRQSGKNETVSQFLCYLLNLLQRTGGNIVYAAYIWLLTTKPTNQYKTVKQTQIKTGLLNFISKKC